MSIRDKLVLSAFLLSIAEASFPPQIEFLELYGINPGQKWRDSTYVDENGYTLPEPDVPLFTPKLTDYYNNGIFGDVDPYAYARVILPSNFQEDYDRQIAERDAKLAIEGGDLSKKFAQIELATKEAPLQLPPVLQGVAYEDSNARIGPPQPKERPPTRMAPHVPHGADVSGGILPRMAPTRPLEAGATAARPRYPGPNPAGRDSGPPASRSGRSSPRVGPAGERISRSSPRTSKGDPPAPTAPIDRDVPRDPVDPAANSHDMPPPRRPGSRGERSSPRHDPAVPLPDQTNAREIRLPKSGMMPEGAGLPPRPAQQARPSMPEDMRGPPPGHQMRPAGPRGPLMQGMLPQHRPRGPIVPPSHGGEVAAPRMRVPPPQAPTIEDVDDSDDSISYPPSHVSSRGSRTKDKIGRPRRSPRHVPEPSSIPPIEAEGVVEPPSPAQSERRRGKTSPRHAAQEEEMPPISSDNQAMPPQRPRGPSSASPRSRPQTPAGASLSEIRPEPHPPYLAGMVPRPRGPIGSPRRAQGDAMIPRPAIIPGGVKPMQTHPTLPLPPLDDGEDLEDELDDEELGDSELDDDDFSV